MKSELSKKDKEKLLVVKL